MTPDFRLGAVRQILISTFSQPQFCVPLLIGLVFAYAGELGQPTFHTDHFFEIWYRNNLLDYWTGYGRYFSKLIMMALGNVYPSTFLLLVGLTVLSCVGVLLAELWGVTGGARPIFVLILCTFPFFLETFSYAPGRYAVPLAIAFGVLAVMRGGAIGFAYAFSALLFYQASAYFAAVVVLVWAAIDALKGRPWFECVKAVVVPKIGLIILAIGVDVVLLRIINAYISPIALMDYKYVSSLDEFSVALRAHSRAILSFFFEPDVFLFPLWTKLIGVAGLIAIVSGVFRASLTLGNRVFVLGILVALPFAAHGANLCIYPPGPFLFGRVLTAYSLVYIGIFAIALASPLNARVRTTIVFLFGLAAVGFVYQANVWHEFLELKNIADIDLARAISDRLKVDASYQPGLPLVMIGTLIPTDYLPYRAFHPKEGIIQNTNINSAYALEWSRDRMIMLFVPFVWPAPSNIATAEKNAKGHHPWPASDSVFVQDNVMTVVLSK